MISNQNYFASASNEIMCNKEYVAATLGKFKDHFVRQIEMRDFEEEARTKKEDRLAYENREILSLCKKFDMPVMTKENFVEYMNHMVSNEEFCYKARNAYHASLLAYKNEMDILCDKATDHLKLLSKNAKSKMSEAEKVQYEEASDDFLGTKSASLLARDLLESFDELSDKQKNIYVFDKFIKNGVIDIDKNEKDAFNDFLKAHPYETSEMAPAKTDAIEAIVSRHEKNKMSKEQKLVVEDFEDIYPDHER